MISGYVFSNNGQQIYDDQLIYGTVDKQRLWSSDEPWLDVRCFLSNK